MMIDRRGAIVGAVAAATALSAGLGACAWDTPNAGPSSSGVSSRGSSKPLDANRRVEAGPLSVAYVEAGPPSGRPVILLHGWPYDIHSYDEVVPLLATQGYRVLVPFLRGYGGTVFRDDKAVRNGQQAALASDVVDFMDALALPRAVVAGFDWGARSADIVAAVWPQRVDALISVSGYLIVDLVANQEPLAPEAELGWWYQYYFATDRGERGYRRNTHDFNRLIWRRASPLWDFDDATYSRSAAAFANDDHATIVIHNYRWRLGLAQGEPQYDAVEGRLAAQPVIAVPTITIGSDFDGPKKDGSAYRQKFSGPYEHRVLDGIGHNVPQEAPRAFAQAVIDAARL